MDYFDALMTERPYHQAMSQEAAIALLVQEAEKGLDPTVVETFIALLPQLSIDVATGATDAPAEPRVFDDIAIAHREIYALYEIAQALGTTLGVAETMAVLSGKLPSLVPFECCALFVFDAETEILRCRFAAGVDADLIQPLAIRSGEGMTGWVAVNRRPLVNARFLFMHLTRELARADRLSSEASLIVMHLERLEAIKKRYGRIASERALCEVARILKAAIRPYDICVRYEGAEFILVLSGRGAEEAERTTRAVREALEAVPFEARPGERVPLTMIAGAAVFPQDGDTFEGLFATADSRMQRDPLR